MRNDPNVRPTRMHKDFLDMLRLNAARNGVSIAKYTEQLVSNPDPLEELAREWKEKYSGRKKIEKRGGYLDFP